MPEATPRLDYIPFKVTTKKEWQQARDFSWIHQPIFFYHFYVYGNNTVYFEAFAAV